jgi:putative tricarboxylic transport membrane protein
VGSRITDRLIAVALAMVGVIVIVSALDFPGDAGLFPIAMGTLLIVSSGVLFIQAAQREGADQKDGPRFEMSRFAIWIALAVLMFLMVWQIDFYLAVFTFILLSYILLAHRGFAFSLVLAALFTVILFLGFSTLLGVPTPSRLQPFIPWL